MATGKHSAPRAPRFGKAQRDVIRRTCREAVQAVYGTPTAMGKRYAPRSDEKRIADRIIKFLQGEAKTIASEGVADMNLSTLYQFAGMTGFRVSYLLTGEEPARVTDSVPRTELADAFASHVIGEVERATGAVAGSVGTPDHHRLLEHATQLVVAELIAARQRTEPLRRISAVAEMLRSVAGRTNPVLAATLGNVLNTRLHDAAGDPPAVEFLGTFFTRTTAKDRAQTKAFRDWVAEQGHDANTPPEVLDLLYEASQPGSGITWVVKTTDE